MSRILMSEALAGPVWKSLSVDPAHGKVAAVTTLLGESLSLVEAALDAASEGPDPLDVAAANLVQAGGKRVRPMMALLMTAACGGDPERAVPLAAAIELMHSASLLHDDVIDEGEVRRGRAASRVVWGNLVSVLSGDLLLTHGLKLLDENSVPGVMSEALAALERVIAGEVAQFQARNRLDLDVSSYLAIVRGKTASLFGFACRSGARAAGRPELCETVGGFGEEVGVAFQVVDDVLDIKGDPKQVGKRLGTDLKEGKTTLPLVMAFEEDPCAVSSLLPAVREGDPVATRRLCEHHAVREGCRRAMAFAEERSGAAIRLLEGLPNKCVRRLLNDMALYLTHRAH